MNEAAELEKLRVNTREWIMADLGPLLPVPQPLFEKPEQDFNHYLSLYAPTDIIFVGPLEGYGSLNTRKVSSIHYDPANVFTAPNLYDQQRIFGRYAEYSIGQKYLILENDILPKAEQYSLLHYFNGLGLPLQMVVDTGGKSLHGWFSYPSSDIANELKRMVCKTRGVHSSGLCFDEATFKRQQIVRTPGSFRVDKQQYQKIIWRKEQQ